MLTQVTTESGSVYVLDDMAGMFVRIPGASANKIDNDSKWLMLAGKVDIAEGKELSLPYVDGEDIKVRTTTPVVNVQVIPTNQSEYEQGIPDELLAEDVDGDALADFYDEPDDSTVYDAEIVE